MKAIEIKSSRLLFSTHFCSEENAGVAINRCNSGTVILWIITGDFGGAGGGGIASDAGVAFFIILGWKRDS